MELRDVLQVYTVDPLLSMNGFVLPVQMIECGVTGFQLEVQHDSAAQWDET